MKKTYQNPMTTVIEIKLSGMIAGSYLESRTYNTAAPCDSLKRDDASDLWSE
jgi:hypothetical protein